MALGNLGEKGALVSLAGLLSSGGSDGTRAGFRPQVAAGAMVLGGSHSLLQQGVRLPSRPMPTTSSCPMKATGRNPLNLVYSIIRGTNSSRLAQQRGLSLQSAEVSLNKFKM